MPALRRFEPQSGSWNAGFRSVHTEWLPHCKFTVTVTFTGGNFDLFDGTMMGSMGCIPVLPVNVTFVMVTVTELVGVDEPLRLVHTKWLRYRHLNKAMLTGKKNFDFWEHPFFWKVLERPWNISKMTKIGRRICLKVPCVQIWEKNPKWSVLNCQSKFALTILSGGLTALFTNPPYGLPPYRTTSGGRSCWQLPLTANGHFSVLQELYQANQWNGCELWSRQLCE